MEWIKTTQKSVPLLARYLATKHSLGMYISETILHNLKINHYKYVHSDNYVQAFFSKEELDDLYLLLGNAIESGKTNDFLRDYRLCGLELINFCRFINNKRLDILSNSEINKLLEQWIQKYTKLLGHVYNGNFCVNIATQKVLESLSKKDEDEEFRILTEPLAETEIKKRQRRILSFLKSINYPDKEFPEFSKLSLESREELLGIHETYRYLGSIFLTTNKYPYFEDFLDEIKSLSNPKEEQESLQKRKEEILDKLNLNEKTKKLVDELTQLAYYRTELLSYIQKAEYYSVNLFEEVARRLKLSYKELVHMTEEEIQQSLLEQTPTISQEQIISRFENYYIELVDGRVRVSLPEKETIDKENIREIKGNCASRGKATGRVKIIRNSSEISKLNQGEILVTFMTTPDYVMAMQKAAAIVTNDGGATCHAAIISRELGVPCIVGTEIATRVLEDGDLVEVDATNEIIKIIEKNTDITSSNKF